MLRGRGIQATEVRRAVAAALSTASSLDLTVDDAIVLSNSNKLTLRLLPCDAFGAGCTLGASGRTVRGRSCSTAREIRVSCGCLEPRVDPRVYERDGFVITLWTYYEP